MRGSVCLGSRRVLGLVSLGARVLERERRKSAIEARTSSSGSAMLTVVSAVRLSRARRSAARLQRSVERRGTGFKIARPLDQPL